MIFAKDHLIGEVIVIMEKVIFKVESYQIIGICMEVHKILGPGFLEAVYKDALEIEFESAGISYQREKIFEVKYKGIVLTHRFKADFVVNNNIILEVKGTTGIQELAIAQAINYLKVSKNRLALLVNFGEPSLTYQRIVF